MHSWCFSFPHQLLAIVVSPVLRFCSFFHLANKIDKSGDENLFTLALSERLFCFCIHSLRLPTLLVAKCSSVAHPNFSLPYFFLHPLI